jgi:hypothetical protein
MIDKDDFWSNWWNEIFIEQVVFLCLAFGIRLKGEEK